MMEALWDVSRLLWLSAVLAVIVWLPAALSSGTIRPAVLIVFEHLAITVLITVTAVSVLSPAHLLNPLTLVLAYGSWPVVRWFVSHRRSIAPDTRWLTRHIALLLVRRVEIGRGWREHPLERRSDARRSWPRRLDLGALTPNVTLVLIALLLSLGPAFASAVANTRLPSVDDYGVLLTTQQLLAGDGGWRRPDVVADLAAALSMVSSIAPVHVLRLLAPLAAAGGLLTLVAVMRSLAASTGPALVGMLVLAAIVAGTVQSNTAALAAIFTLMAIACATGPGRRSRGCAVVATVLAVMLRPTWAMLAPYAWATLAALTAGVIARRYQFQRPPVRTAFAGAVVLLVIAANIPKTTAARFVEYDSAARQALAIATEFPNYRWMIVAPIEEWPLSYGKGWHMNLHEFVADVGARIDEEGYWLPYQVDELFVFVETRPFAMFESEPADVPFRTLIDPVYRHYRSPAGRASLQFAAYRLCERLQSVAPNAGVYSDDGRLKIYRFTLR